jgi:hypothetical protein
MNRWRVYSVLGKYLNIQDGVGGSQQSRPKPLAGVHHGKGIMTRQKRTTGSCISLFFAISLLPLSAFAAEKKQATPAAPIPAQIAQAKKIFVANAGWDDYQLFSGSPTRAYDQFYAALKTAGRYELVGNAADADLIFQIQFGVYVAPGARSGSGPSLGPVPYDAQFRLEIRDPKTNVLLWAFVERPDQAMLQGNRDKNFDDAMMRIEGDVQMLGSAGAPPATQQ